MEIRAHQKLGRELVVRLDATAFDKLKNQINDTFFSDGHPDREIVLREQIAGEDWTLFLRMKEGEIKLLSAHPDKTSWVVTVTLPKSDITQLLNSLNRSEKVDLSVLKPSNLFNNIAVSFETG